MEDWPSTVDEAVDRLIARLSLKDEATIARMRESDLVALNMIMDFLIGEEFGINAGIAFQLVDDLLDYISSEEELGKPVGNDLKEGKITLPLIYTLSTLEEAERRQLMDLFKNNLANDQDYRQLIGLVRDNGVVDRIKADAKAYVDKAARCLDMFPPSWSRKMLLELNRYIIEREY